ncbi:uncharacterized protein TrAtP1_007618 [Trichoderma atroviride]|uniref:uncharacterized protein n=1 Tax=Hypocrea atroviridis TaxID=63577 RepID=UPI00332B941D|nr:hypothetical protein TrAtP1_007618 [Trichoderma atroviride]
MPLDDDEKECAVKEWISTAYESRPRFARLLSLEWLEEGNDELLAAYLGFNTVPHLYYFMHFQVPNQLRRLIQIYYQEYCNRLYISMMDLFPPASGV